MIRLNTIPAVGILLALAVMPVTVTAVEILGPGNRSCGTWLGDRQRNPSSELIEEAWILGYLSSFNNFSPNQYSDVTKGIDNAGLLSWIDSYCQAHPLDPLFHAVNQLIGELGARRH
jgi:hypothetical protein